jgi:CheY-like chemotaxis protein
MKKFNKVLLVDDDDISNGFTSILLEEMEITNQLIILHDGQEALEYIEQNCVHSNLHQNLLHRKQCLDLILLDIRMPLIDGFDFLKAFNDLESVYNTHIASVVILTSSRQQEDITKALRFNVSGYIEKPLTHEKISQILAMMVH